MQACVFCQIVNQELPAHRVWEDEGYVAFLSIFPNTDGFTVLIPKEHLPSNFANCPPAVVKALTQRAQVVSQQICRAFRTSVERCALVYEGYGVNHLHAKLIPLHQTANKAWQPMLSKSEKFFTEYEGYISTQEPSQMADSDHLAAVAAKIRAAAK